MPHMCCVPKCKGNYASGEHVSTFGFPKDPILSKKWINAIKRDNFVPTSASRVCELHFNPQDIETATPFLIESTGETISVPLNKPRLISGAIPSKLPGCPDYLSKAVTYRGSPEAKKLKMENDVYSKFQQKNLGDWLLNKTKQFKLPKKGCSKDTAMAPVKDICRICLQETDDGETQDINVDKLRYFTNSCLFPVLDLKLFQNHVICDTCIYNFRTVRIIHKHAQKGNKEVNKQRINKPTMPRYIQIKPLQRKFLNTQDNLGVCRLCFEPTKDVAIYLWKNSKNILPLTYINTMLDYIDLNMDLLQSTVNPMLCYQCWQRVQIAFSFQKRVEAVREKCGHYLNLLRKTDLDREDLNDIIHMWDNLGCYHTEITPDEIESPISTQQSSADESPAHKTMPQSYIEYIFTVEHNYCDKRPSENSRENSTNSDDISAAANGDDFDMPVLIPCVNENAKELKKVQLQENSTRRTQANDTLEFVESILGLQTPKRKKSNEDVPSNNNNRDQIVDDSFRRLTRLSSLKQNKREFSSNELLVSSKTAIQKKRVVKKMKLASKLKRNKAPLKDIPNTQSPVDQSSDHYTIERLNFDNEVQRDTVDDDLRKKKPKALQPEHKLNGDSPKNNASRLSNKYTFEWLTFYNDRFDKEAIKVEREEEECKIDIEKSEVLSDSDDAFIETLEQCPNLTESIKSEPAEIKEEEEDEPPQLEFQGPCHYDPQFTIFDTFSLNDKRNLISVDEKRNLLNASKECPALESEDPMAIIRDKKPSELKEFSNMALFCEKNLKLANEAFEEGRELNNRVSDCLRLPLEETSDEEANKKIKQAIAIATSTFDQFPDITSVRQMVNNYNNGVNEFKAELEHAFIAQRESDDDTQSSGNEANSSELKRFINDKETEDKCDHRIYKRRNLESKWGHQVKKLAGFISAPCDNTNINHLALKLQCRALSEEMRQRLHNKFWSNMSWKEKKMYVKGLVQVCWFKPRRGPLGLLRRIKYFLKNGVQLVRVCKKMFAGTLGLNNGVIYHWVISSEETLDQGENKQKRESREEIFKERTSGVLLTGTTAVQLPPDAI